MNKEYRFKHNVFFDSCAFNPSDPFEQKATSHIFKWIKESIIIPEASDSVLKELEHPNTPIEVRKVTVHFLSNQHITLTLKQTEILNKIKGIIIGKARTETYENDALHVFIADDLAEYFITTDNRILKRKNEIKNVSTGIKICKPSEFVRIVEDDNGQWVKRMKYRNSIGDDQ